jgi:hypothetical protein
LTLQHHAQEGELLEKEQVATYITDAAEKRVAVSKATEAELMDSAGGSVQNLLVGKNS